MNSENGINQNQLEQNSQGNVENQSSSSSSVAAAPPVATGQDSVQHTIQHATHDVNNNNNSTTSNTQSIPNATSQPQISNGSPQPNIPSTTSTNIQSPLPPVASSPSTLPAVSSSSASVDALLTAATTSSPSTLQNPSATPSTTNGNGVSAAASSSLPSLDAPPSSAIPNHQPAVLSPLKVDSQPVVESGKPESISVGSDSKVIQPTLAEAAKDFSSSSTGNHDGQNGKSNGDGAVNGNASLSTADSGFIDGPSMVSGAPGTVDAAAQSLSQERLTEGQNSLPPSVSPSLAPPQHQAQPPAPSASPTPAPIPSPVAAASPAAPKSENLAVPASLPPQQQPQQPQQSPSLPIPSPVAEPSSNQLSPAPPVQPSQAQAPAPAALSEDVKMTDGTLGASSAPTPASISTPSAASTPIPAVQSSIPGPTSQSSTQAQNQPHQPASAPTSQPQQQQQQPADTVMQAPPSEASSLPQQPPQQPLASNPQSNVGSDVAISAPPAQPSTAPVPTPNAPQQPQTSNQVPPASSDYSAQPDSAVSAAAPRPGEGSEPPSKRQRFEGEGAVDANGTPIVGMTAAQIKFAQNSIKSLKSRPEAPAFLQPVDPIALGIPQYRTFITHPADLGSIDIKLALTSAAAKSQASGGAEIKPTEKVKLAPQFGLDPKRDVYRNAALWEEEVRRVFSNCRKFNGPEHPLSKGCDAMEKTFDKQMSSFPSAKPQDTSTSASTSSFNAAADDSFNDKKIRRPSNPVPTIRRSSDDAGGRPKREIHPPPPKDMPYWDEPTSGISNRGGAGGAKRKAKTSAANSVAERAYNEKVNKDELRFCEKVIQELYGPKHQAVAWVFYDLVDRNLDFAPAYYASIKNPISLREIQSKLKSGDYENRRSFDADMQLLFRNCFAFNPPGTDVHTMGQKVKQAYEGRMRSMPKPPPFVAPQEFGDEYYNEDGGDDAGVADDSSDALMAAQIRQQIESLQANLAQLEGSKNKNPKAIANTKASLASMQSSAMTKPPRSRPAPPAASSALPAAAAPAPAPAAPRKSGGGRKANGEKKKANGAGGGTKRKNPSGAGGAGGGGAGGKRKSNGGGAGSDEDVRVVTYEQKEELASKITELPDDRLDGALRIIAEDKPHNANDEEEIELDIDDLSPKTLYKLYKYVVRPKKPRTAGGSGAGGAAAGQKKKKNPNKGGHKNRVLDEAAEAKRIASLQTQLSQFEHGVPQAPAAGPSGAHDDMVDSGSSGSESDSDSDDDAY